MGSKVAENTEVKEKSNDTGNIVDMEDGDESSPMKSDVRKEKLAAEKRKLTLREQLRVIKEIITVEPILICYFMPSVLASMAAQNLYLEKTCRVNFNFSEEICDALSRRETENYTEYENQVQTYVANLQNWKITVNSSIMVFLILFVGAWSDKTGRRKACILMPIVGEFLTCLGFIVNKYFFYELPVEVAALTEVIFPAITGGWYTSLIGIYSFIGDVTTVEQRTYRVGLANICMTLGFPVGTALSGILLELAGYYGIFCISIGLYMISLLYGYIYLRDPNRKVLEKRSHNCCLNFFIEFFDFRLVQETFKVVFKKGPGNRRLRVSLLLIVVFVIFGPTSGEFNIMYLFARLRFNWDALQYSYWATYQVVTNLLGTMFSIMLFSQYLKMHDTLLGVISCVSKVLGAFAYAFARNNIEIYIAPLIEILNGTAFVAMRSIATKLVSGEEFGKVNSLFALAEAMTPLVYVPLYTRVYTATLHVLPGAIFLLGAVLILPGIGVYIWLYLEYRKDVLQERVKNIKSSINAIE